MTDDVRRALSAYAATTPDLDPRAGLPERLARRARVRNASVAGIACLAALVAGSGVAVLSRPDGTSSVVASGDPTGDPSGEPPASSTGDPEPTSTPVPTTHPTPSGTVPPPSEQPAAPPREPIVREAGGPDGLRVRVTLDPGGVATADPATLAVVAEDDDGQPVLTGVSWGDGTYEPIAYAAVACVSRQTNPLPLGSQTPQPREPQPGRMAQRIQHSWRHAGTFTVTVTVETTPTCDPEPEEESQRVSFDVPVTPGRDVSNGGVVPHAAHAEVVAPDDGELYERQLTASLRDEDGYVSSVTVDWGDGTVETFTNDAACDDGGGRHFPMHGWMALHTTHVYEDPGDYTVLLRVTSRGCDGGDRQTGTERVPHLVESVD